ncbi:MAG: SDR family NAD(P)-dependent oxidoreductase, partial [Dongiaceae bacterium]
MNQRFANRVVLVTGAAGGLGRGFAEGFADEGATLVLTDVDAAGMEQTAERIREKGGRCSGHRLDLAVESDIQAFAAEVAGQHPQIDVLVNNAGLAYGEVAHAFEALNQARWLHYLAINSVAPLLLAQALRAPLAQARGVVLNLSSMASYVPATAYGVTKATLNAMTYGMANVFAADGIRVNAIAPGLVETPASQAQLNDDTRAHIQG